MKHENITSRIIKIFYEVYNEMGYGFLEKVYENAMSIALVETGFKVEAQKQINVYFRGKQVGVYFADIVVDDLVIIELKATEVILDAHGNQLLNYIKGTEMEVGLLLNFGIKPEIKRKVYDNTLKPNLKKHQ